MNASASSTDPLVTGVDFVTVPTRDLPTALRFYGETLGLPCSVHLPDRHYAEFETSNLTLSVVDADAMGIPYHAQHGLSLHVDDVAQARSALEGRGVVFKGDIFDTGVCHMAFFADPDGNSFMLHHRYAPRPPRA
jgi:catechol 2,3-dioxygenase-like lactoylglutathione lyase family enzyme